MSEGKRDKQFYEQRASDDMAQYFLLKPKAIEAMLNYFTRQIRRDQGAEVIK